MTELLDVGEKIAIGRYRLFSRFRSALIFVRENGSLEDHACRGLACVVNDGKGDGPLNIVVRGLDFDGTSSLDVGLDSLVLGGVALKNRRRYHAGLSLGPVQTVRLRANLQALEGVLVESASWKSVAFLLDQSRERYLASAFEQEFARRFRAGVERLAGGDPKGGAAMIKGLGFGLTPSGDDFLAGFLLGLHAFETAGAVDYSGERHLIYEAASGVNRFSAALLWCAFEGWYFERAKRLVEVLFEGPEEDIAPHAARLMEIGATSGADLGTGLAFALRRYLKQAHRPAGEEARSEVTAW